MNLRSTGSRNRSLRIKLGLAASLLPLAVWVASCSVSVGVGPGAVQFGVDILGKSFTLTFGDIGALVFKAGVRVTVPTAFTLFDETPREVPPSGRMILPTDSVGVGRLLEGKVGVQSQSLPLNGSGTLTFSIASGQSAALCDSAVLMSEFDIALTSGVISVLDEEYELSQAALDIIATNDVTICIEMDADFDGELTLGDFALEFDGGEPADDDDADAGSDPDLSGGAFVPIDNRAGRAVLTSVNRIIGGISYGIVGVLEDQTPAVTVETANPNTISIDPFALGLATVTELHMAVHSSFVPDVSEGVQIATLTAEYAQDGEPTVLTFVLGTNTAEWSYTRIEHVTAFGGVQHSQSPVLYDFRTTVDSAAEYTGYSYYVGMPLDSLRTLSRLTLTMSPAETFPPVRAATGGLANWAAQAITAVTLEGVWLPPPEPELPEACCTEDGACVDMEPEPCQLDGGTVLGPGTTCAANSAECDAFEPEDDEPDDPDPVEPTGGCCFVNGDCEDRTEESCVFVLGDYQGDGTSCDSLTCTPQIEYVVWYTGNVCCWGAPLLYISDRITFNQPRSRSSFPGGGIDPSIPAIKVEMQGGFASREDAQNWICPQFTSSSFHYWCGRHYQMGGKNWQPGSLGCDFSTLPDTTTPPEADVCKEVADSMLDIVACCYPDTTCAEVDRPDCSAGGGKPHPGGHDRCGVEVCPGSPPACPRDNICELDCPSFDGDPDCDFCDSGNRCVEGCATPDQDCCLGLNVLKNGDAEDTAAAQNFDEIVRLNAPIDEGWNVFQGNMTPVAYAIGRAVHPNPAISAKIGGGNNYFAGGPGGVSPTIAQQGVFLNLFVPLEVVQAEKVKATLSADIGGFTSQSDYGTVEVSFRDELLNEVQYLGLGWVTPAHRGNVTGFVHRCGSMIIHKDAVTAEVRIIIYRFNGSYNDGYVDNVSLYLEHIECDNPVADACVP
ncbi:MAG: hypothetical protein PVI86_04540 [Phycisphaerae bacterium]